MKRNQNVKIDKKNSTVQEKYVWRVGNTYWVKIFQIHVDTVNENLRDNMKILSSYLRPIKL